MRVRGFDRAGVYWPRLREGAGFDAPTERDIRVDVLVVGGGVSGALVAEELARAGVRVAVVDKGEPGLGSTAASTALLQYEIDVTLVELMQKLGAERAEGAYRLTLGAVNAMPGVVGRLGDDCGHRARRSLQVAASSEERAELEREAEARRRIGIDVAVVEGSELEGRFGIRRPVALLSERGYEVDPLRLTYALLRAAAARGACIVPNTEVDLSGAAAGGTPVAVCHETGRTFAAEWVVVATGYEAPSQFAAVAKRTTLKSTYAAAVVPRGRAGWGESTLLWETATPYFYGRAAEEGRLLIGGEDEDFVEATARDALIDAKAQRLVEKLAEVAPGVDAEVECAWAGTFAETEDGLPFIGRHPRWGNVLFALGYGGNGITFSVIAAGVIREIVCTGKSKLEGLFSFERE